MLWTFVEKQDDWERYLPLVLYAYRTSVHLSTGVTPFSLMFGRVPSKVQFPPLMAFEPGSYLAHLNAKLSELRKLFKMRSETLPRPRRNNTICTMLRRRDPYIRVTLFGSLYRQLVNWIHDGREDGLSKLLRVLSQVKYLMASVLKLST